MRLDKYRPPLLMHSGHLQSIYASLEKPRHQVLYQRERIATADGDFLDLDWSPSKGNSTSLVLLSHGLEGNSGRNYITGMVATLNRADFDCCAWNFRGCSGEPNRSIRMYHSGSIDDLGEVIEHICTNSKYSKIFLVGYSMGANLQLLYLGNSVVKPDKIAGSVAFSAPCDLAAAAHQLSRRSRSLYMRRFLHDLREKISHKCEQFPGEISLDGFEKIKNFSQFDQIYTAPLHGFSSALSYWQQCSSLPVLDKIELPTLIVSSRDDPFLAPSCYPDCSQNKNLQTLYPQYGGHVGFVLFNQEKEYWSEQVCRKFLSSLA